MQRLFIGKFVQGEQYKGNYYEVENESLRNWFGEIVVGDLVIPIQSSEVEKLLKFKGFTHPNGKMRAEFDLVKNFSPSFSAGSILSVCKYFIPDITLLNKMSKSTIRKGFHPVALEDGCPPIDQIDFPISTRKFYIIVNDFKHSLSFLKPNDICVILDSISEMNIQSIEQFDGNDFVQYKPLWELYIERNKDVRYSLRVLLEYASPTKDNARNKFNYLKAAIQLIEKDQYIVIDKPVALYDNILVGRLVTKKPKSDSNSLSDDKEDDLEDDFETLTEYENYARLLDFNPNIILYGPPGTGKTYGAMRIIEAYERLIGNPVSFETVRSESRANFITFHQSFSYEEFIEGLRPETSEEGEIRYQVKNGIFKRISEDCKIDEMKGNADEIIPELTNSNSKVWKVSLGRRDADSIIYETFMRNNQIGIGYGPDMDISDEHERFILQADPSKMSLYLRDKMQIGDLVLIFNSVRSIRAIGVVTSDYIYSNQDGIRYPHRRNVQWLKRCEKEPIDIYKLNNNKQLTLSSLYELKITVSDVLNLLEDKKVVSKTRKPYYLIIDEINRGNIAKIFGELITLIEKDKRETLTSVLPYSGQEFSIPKNLFIIGTMNTSDRSIALLDTALRRRFAFIEVAPDPLKIGDHDAKIGGYVSPIKLLQAINKRISEKIDRDHRIGHSYFMDDVFNKQDLYYVWYYKVLPLLMEYFYHDVSQISEIVTENFFDKKTSEVVYLNLKPNENGISDFEKALIDVYQNGV